MLKVKRFALAQAGAGHPQARLGPEGLGWREDIHSPPDAILLRQMEATPRPAWVPKAWAGATGGCHYDEQIYGRKWETERSRMVRVMWREAEWIREGGKG